MQSPLVPLSLSLALVGATTLAACGPRPASPLPSDRRAATSTAPPKLAPAPARAVEKATIPDPPPPKSPPLAIAPLFVLAEIETFFSLTVNALPTQKKGAASTSHVVLLQAASFLAELHGDEIRQPADLLVGMPEYLNFGSPMIAGTAGTYPDKAFVRIIPGARRRGAGEILRLQKGRWVRAGQSLEPFEATYMEDVGDHVISLSIPWEGKMALTSLTGGGLAGLPNFEDPNVPWPSWMSIQPTGDIYAPVQTEGSAFGMGILRWSPKDRKAHIDKLPWPSGADPDAHELSGFLHIRARNDIYYASGAGRGDGTSSGYLAHFDGTKWTVDAPPNDEWVTSLAVAPDGTAWIVTSTRDGQRKRLSRRAPGGSWEELALPAPIFSTRASAPELSIEDVYEIGGDIVATAHYADSNDSSDLNASRSVLLRTSKVKNPILVRADDFPTIDELADPPEQPPAITRGAPPGPASSACSSIFLLLGPSEQPSVISALREHPAASELTLVETNGGAKSYLGATVRSFEEGEALKKHLRERIQEARPKLLCGIPTVKRRIPLSSPEKR